MIINDLKLTMQESDYDWLYEGFSASMTIEEADKEKIKRLFYEPPESIHDINAIGFEDKKTSEKRIYIAVDKAVEIIDKYVEELHRYNAKSIVKKIRRDILEYQHE